MLICKSNTEPRKALTNGITGFFGSEYQQSKKKKKFLNVNLSKYLICNFDEDSDEIVGKGWTASFICL